MPHALLLSPDDQAVNAITGVLEEMSVTCERPLDGVSAAQKLNSQSFDLVLVDCENLPAAKLIFDVCRRGKNGHNPVPIAIVDGRAGLPTAFRLGAELILTKPVAKDQARTTIRTAVSRVRKDVATDQTPAAQTSGSPLSEVTTAIAVVKEEQAKAATAAASSQLTSFADPVPSFSPSATLGSSSATDEQHAAPVPSKVSPLLTGSAVSLPEFSDSSAVKSLASSKPKAPTTLSDDPVLAELEREELEASALEEVQAPKVQKPDSGAAKAGPDHTTAPSDAPAFSSYQQGRQKPRGVFVALMILVVVAGGFYGAWMYQPGFRTFVEPQIDRVLALAGMALPPTRAQQPPSPVAQPTPAPVAAPAVDSSKTESTVSDSTASAAVPSASSLTTPANASSALPQPSSQTVAGTPQASLPAVTVAPTVKVSKTAATKPAEIKKAQTAAAPSDATLPGENSTIILSSKGAEKRLAHSVPPKYPADARSEGAEGTVVLKEVVDENGKVEGVRLVEGNAILATAAMQAVKQWRYRPYVRDGRAQPFQTVVIVDFQKP